MATITTFEKIEAWQTARELCKEIGNMIDNGNFKSNYRLINQIEGSSGSIMDNIAEGFERGSRAEFIVFLGYAKGSCGELRSQLYRAIDRTYISPEAFNVLFEKAVRISSMLQKFISYLQKTNVEGVRKKNVKP
jgi:four helix bundle protein